MKLSIRTRLAVFYTLAFFAVLFLVLSSIALALYRELDQRADKSLRIEQNWLQERIETEFLALASPDCESCEALSEKLVEELNERYIYRGQFAIISFHNGGVYYGGREKTIPQKLPEDLLLRKDGFSNLLINRAKSRVLVKQHEWGTLALGRENQTFQEVGEEFFNIIHWILPLAILFVLIGGWIMARLVMRPVVSAVEAAEEITITNLQQRLPEYTGEDEFGILVRTLNRMIARIEEGVKRIQQFTQDAAHELRTPLTIMRGELELTYQQERLSEDMQASLQKTLDRVISMSKVVDNLMLLAQTDTGSYPVHKTKFRLDEVVKEIFEDINILVENRPVNVKLAYCQPVEVLADKQLIYRLFLNLCDNALKYTEQGFIELSLKSWSDIIEFKIKDTGCGIPPEQLPHIFDRFYRVDKSRTSSTGGSGLGLSIGQWIAHAHGGEIYVESEINRGTTVKIHLPLQKS